jgi:putative ABC transport system permease protein
MKYLPLLLANLSRKKIRTILTIGSFAVALFLFGILAAVRGAFSQGIEVAGSDRLVVVNKTSIIQPLPFSYRDRLLRIPGVTGATFASWFGGVYQDERNFFPQFAIDVPTYRTIFPEFVIPDDQWKSFVEDREGAVVGQGLAKKFNWKVGDRIPIRATYFQGTWEFNIRGIYKGSRDADDLTQFWFHGDYLEERRPFGKGVVGWYTIRIDNPDHAVAIVKAVDAEFANSPYETKTDTEKAFAAGFAKQMGNIQLLIMSIGAVVFFTLLLVTGNTMATSIRERIRELAVLKAVGYSDRFVLGIVFAEGLLIALIGGSIGLILAKALTLSGDPTRGLLPYFHISATAFALGLLCTIVIGILSTILPATSAMRLRVVDALRRV